MADPGYGMIVLCSGAGGNHAGPLAASATGFTR